MKRIVALLAVLAAGPAWGQGLYAPSRAQDETARAGAPGIEAARPLRIDEVSTLYIEPPEPRVIAKHDLVTIVIDENTSTTSEQTLETDKSYDTSASVAALLDPWQLLELRLRQGNISDVDLIRAKADRSFTGEGEYERRDRFSARITATVLEVKPNGTVVLEARKHVARDTEEQTLVLSGLCRQEDITLQNTVLSSQIAGLQLVLTNEGEVRDSAKKGLISRVLDTIFAF